MGEEEEVEEEVLLELCLQFMVPVECISVYGVQYNYSKTVDLL